MPRAKREVEAVEDAPDEQLDHTPETDTLTGAIPEGELALARSVAKRLGWKGPEEWTGAPDQFVDAPEFLDNTPKVIADLKESGKRAAQAAAAAIEDERRRIREEATRTIRDSDDREEREKAAERLAQNAGPPPETQAWLARNPWFQTDPDAQAIATSTVNRMAAQGASISLQLEEAEKSVRQRFPEYFSAGTEQRLSDVRRQAPIAPQVQQGSRAGGNGAPKEKGFAEIPQADRAAFNGNLLKHFMARGLTQEESQRRYAASYWRVGVTDPSERPEERFPLTPQSNIWAKRRGNTRV